MRADIVFGFGLSLVGCANVCEAVSSANVAMTGPDATGRATFRLMGPPQNAAHPSHVLVWAWSSTSGTIDSSHGMDATLTCDRTGPVMISLRITDGVCEQSKLLTVDCSVACEAGMSCNASVLQAGASGGH
jgi:hypothetical protein